MVCIRSLVFCLLVSAWGCHAFDVLNPTSKKVLLLAQDAEIEYSHSLYIESLRAKGYTVDFGLLKNESLVLQAYGVYFYDAAIIFAPDSEDVARGLDVNAILEFVDSGHDLILAGGVEMSDYTRDISVECGVDFDENPEAMVIDHQNWVAAGEDISHTLIQGGEVVNSKSLLGPQKNKSPVIFRGVGMSVSATSDLVFPILSASDSAYSATPGSVLTAPPALHGTGITLIAGMQARNDARVVISGSLDFFSNKFFKLEPSIGKTTANADVALQLSLWAFHERGHLKAGALTHHKQGEQEEPAIYRITDQLHFEVEILEWSGDSWQPYKAKDVQVQFYMMSPYVLKNLTHDNNGLFSTDLQVPDVYGVFQIKVEYNRVGYTTLHLTKQIPVRPFRHDEYERFIPSAYPYYTSTFSMMTGFFVLGFVFLYHKDNNAKKTE